MKRVLSLVLALSLVLGSIPAGFAATPTAGETLKGYGLLAGDQSGNLNEDKEITRGEMMVVLARLLGKFDEAKAYSIPSTSKDVAGHWAAAYIAFAEKEAWTSGKGNGMFDPNGKVTLQETAAFMMKALGYTVTDFSKVVDEATKLNLLKDVKTTDAAKAIVRADLFTAALNTVNTPVKDSTQKLGEKLGVIKVVASALDPKAAKGISHNTMQVTLNAAATAATAADFSVVDKDGKALEVKDAKFIDSKTVWFTTADQTAGKLYTVKVAGKSYTVTGLQKDTTLPEIVKADTRVQDNQTLRIVFSKNVDPRNALVAANYTFTNGLTATAAAFEKDKDGVDVRTVVLLSTSAQEVNKLYKLTVGAGVTDYYGNKLASNDEQNLFSFTGLKADTTAPRIKSVTAENGQKLVIEFTEDSDLSKDNALNVANYVFVDKTDSAKTVTATAAEFKLDVNNKNTIVKLTTTAQIEKHSYELTINNLTDKFGNALVANKTSFTGAPLDTTGPKIEGIQTLSNTSVKVIFTEDVDATATVVANYVANNDLAVTAAVADSNADNIIWLTTSAQKVNTTYKLTVSNVKDLYGNAISTGNVQYFNGMAEDTTKPEVSNAVASVDANGITYVTVTFSEAVTEASAKTAANYYFGSTIGYGISVSKISDSVYKVKVNALADGTVYTLAVSNVVDLAGNTINYDDSKNERQFVGKVSDDTAAPKLVTAVTMDKRTVKLIFDKAMDPTQLVNFAANYTVKDSNGTALSTQPTVVNYKKESNNKEISFRFNADVFVNASNGNNTTFTIFVKPAVVGINGTAINTSYDELDVYSTSTNPAEVKVSSATSLDKKSVDVKFNQSIKTTGLTATNIEFVNLSQTKTNLLATSAVVTDADDSIMKVNVTGLIAGDKYEIRFNGTTAVTGITDVYGDKGLTSTSADLRASFYASSNTNVAPSVVTYANGTIPGKITVNMSEEVDLTGATANGTVTLAGETSANVVKLVEAGADNTKVDIYFDNTGMIQGKTYTITIAKGAITDLSGDGNTDAIKLTFGVTSGTRDAVQIQGVTVNKTATGFDTLTVVFNKAVKGVVATSLTVSGSSVTAMTNTAGTAKTNADYVTVVVLKLGTKLTSGAASNLVLPANMTTAKDGAQNAAQTVEFTVPAE